MLKKFGAFCSYNVCGNAKLRDFIAANLSESAAQEYRETLDQAIRDPDDAADVSGIALVETKKEEDNSQQTTEQSSAPPTADVSSRRPILAIFAFAAAAIFLLGFFFDSRDRRQPRR